LNENEVLSHRDARFRESFVRFIETNNFSSRRLLHFNGAATSQKQRLKEF